MKDRYMVRVVPDLAGKERREYSRKLAAEKRAMRLPDYYERSVDAESDCRKIKARTGIPVYVTPCIFAAI